MNRRERIRLLTLVMTVVLASAAVQGIQAQTGGGIDLSWHVLSSGGASSSSGGSVTLGSSVGQFGSGTSSGGAVTLSGGFWNPASGAPLAVTLANFSAAQQGDAVLVTWETASELDNLGFNLHRGVDPAGPDRQINAALIPSQSPGSSGGYAYTWEDRADLAPGATYVYWLEDVDIHGVTTMHSPVSVTYQAPTAVTLAALRPDSSAASVPWALALAAVSCTGGLLFVRRRISAR